MVNIYTLVNGEQIIGKYTENNDPGFSTIGDPYYIVEAQDEYGNSVMKLINVCTFSTERCIIVNDSHIVFSIASNKKMAEYYEKLVASYNNKETTEMLEESIKDLEDMEESMRDIISQRLVGGSTIN